VKASFPPGDPNQRLLSVIEIATNQICAHVKQMRGEVARPIFEFAIECCEMSASIVEVPRRFASGQSRCFAYRRRRDRDSANLVESAVIALPGTDGRESLQGFPANGR
jgi:hypothetical protein